MDGLEDDFPLPGGPYSQVPAVNLPGCKQSVFCECRGQSLSTYQPLGAFCWVGWWWVFVIQNSPPVLFSVS